MDLMRRSQALPLFCDRLAAICTPICIMRFMRLTAGRVHSSLFRKLAYSSTANNFGQSFQEVQAAQACAIAGVGLARG